MIEIAAVMDADAKPGPLDGHAIVFVLTAVVDGVPLIKQANGIEGSARNVDAHKSNLGDIAEAGFLPPLKPLPNDGDSDNSTYVAPSTVALSSSFASS
jgi:hypothetical protein